MPALLGLALLVAGCSWLTRIENAWIRLPAAPGRPGAGYFDIEAASGGVTLASVSGPFERAEFHETRSRDGMSSMAPIAAIRLGSGEDMEFEPGGRHLMLFGLDPGLRPGDRVSLHFFQDTQQKNPAAAPVEALVVGPGDPNPYPRRFLGLW